MEMILKKKWGIPACITAGLLIVTLILTLFVTPASFLFLLAACVALIVTITKLDDELIKWVKLAVPALAFLQFIFLLISLGSIYYYVDPLSMVFSFSNVAGMVAFMFAVLGVTTMVALVCFRKCWKIRTILLGTVVLFVAILVTALLSSIMPGAFWLSIATVLLTYLYAAMVYLSIIGWVYVCNKFRAAAADKGYEENRCYFWIPFLLPLVGMILVAALPNKRMTEALERLSPVPEKPVAAPAAPKHRNPAPVQEPAAAQAEETEQLDEVNE